MGILLLNVVTGLMVDTFGAVREDKERRDDIRRNSCFVCGMERDRYEDLGLVSSPFASHVDPNEGHHAVWQYVYFKVRIEAFFVSFVHHIGRPNVKEIYVTSSSLVMQSMLARRNTGVFERKESEQVQRHRKLREQPA